MKCICCGENIDHVNVSFFNRDGSDGDIAIPVNECEENAVYMDLDTNWTGYELTEDEQYETIMCPKCGKFPFKKELQIHEIVRVVSFIN